MSSVIVPEGYKPRLSVQETEEAIIIIKRFFEDKLGKALNLKRVSAPLFVDPGTGLNDNLNGTERPVSFEVKETGEEAQIIHSLAKWKRLALHKYGFLPGNGLFTNMNAIRRDEELTNIHSIYVDQWDWELIITPEQRSENFLKETVTKIVNAICETNDHINKIFSGLSIHINKDVFFVTSQELYDMYPGLTPKEREDAVTKEKGTVFIMKIGGNLSNGERHDGRAPDYDDWQLNGDILFWNEVLGRAMELSSMGIRVNSTSLDSQLTAAGCDDRRELPFHKMVLDDALPLTMGGGVGQSRLCMLLLGNAHIGEVQVSLWDRKTLQTCESAGITLL